MAEKRTLPYVDILKFIFAVLVFLLHVGILTHIPYYTQTRAITVRFAVPFFFVASGYFYANKLIALKNKEERRAATCKYCKRLGIKLIVFEPFSILILAAGRLVVEHMSLKDVLIISLKEMLFYPRGALWYIQALIVGVLILFPLVHYGKEKTAIPFAILLYSIALIGTRYYFLIQDTFLASWIHAYERIFLTVRNGLFEGFPLMLCGSLIARYQDRIKACKGTVRALFCIVSILIVYCESQLLRPYPGHDDSSLYISYLFAVPALFSLAAFAKENKRINTKTIVFRNLSTSIYLLHSPVGRVTKFAMGFIMLNNIWVYGAVTAAIMGIICFAVYRKKSMPFYGWLV